MDEQFKYTIVDNVDHIIDEKGNSFVALRKMYWGEDSSKANLELRKWYNTSDGGERPSKGVTFITAEGPSTLTHTLISMGYGNTQRILESLKSREDFRPSLNKVLGDKDEFYDKTIPENLYVPGDDMFYYEED